jgi:glucose/mannose-6-phosphate isomerase
VVSAAVPEADHNDVMGLEGGLGSGRTLVLLRDLAGEHPRDAVRLDAVTRAVGAEGASAPLRADGGDGPDLVRFARLVAFADYTSVYLALRRGVDPTGIETIDRVKAHVAAAEGA